MATSKLYPSLSCFYRNTYVGFGSEVNITLISQPVDLTPPGVYRKPVDLTPPGVYRKPLQDDHIDNKLTTSREKKKMDREKNITLIDMRCHSTDKSNQANMSDQRQKELNQANMSGQRQKELNQANMSGQRQKELNQANMSGQRQKELNQANMPGQRQKELNQANMSGQRQKELTQNERNKQLAGYLTDSLPCLPTTPPLDWSDELIERFLEDTLTQQELLSLESQFSTFDTQSIDYSTLPVQFNTPSIDYSTLPVQFNTPSIDYSTLPVPINTTGDRKVSWVDDVLPDYDETDTLNNLNKEVDREPRPAEFVQNIAESRKRINPRLNSTTRPEATHQSQPNYQPQPQRKAKETVRDAIYISRNQTSDLSDDINIKIKNMAHQTNERKSVTGGIISPSNYVDEYSAWMTWRKQVNRQLATAILLRKDNELQKHNSGVCKKSFNQSSFDIISQYGRYKQNTPLGGKPFVMYGIPRVSLPNN